MKIEAVVTFGFIVCLFCIYKFTRILNEARSKLTDDEYRRLENQGNAGFLEFIIPVTPVLASYFVQDHLPIHPVLTVSLAGLMTVAIIWVQQIKTIKRLQAEGIPGAFLSEYFKANAFLWFGIIVFATTYMLTGLGWVS